jgi:hypothetical protein
MFELLHECNNFFKDCGFSYAMGGGWALELFVNKKIRNHADIDISIFDEHRKNIVEFMLNNNWNVYEHKADWIDNNKANSCLRSILNSDDEKIPQLHNFWTIKPDCSFFKIKPKPDEDNIFDYEILNKEQVNFDFIEIICNKQKNGKFIFDPFISQNKDITRELDKAILYNNGIPYLAPEVMLFIISHPAYIESEFHKVKNHIDFDSTAPFLPKENKDWLINALETAYPEGHKRLDILKGN